ncbi:MAG: lysoplasmalogenase family protein, partial [bacterium]
MIILKTIIAVLIVAVILLIRAEIQFKKKQIYLFKPISTILVIVVVLIPLVNGNYMSLYYSMWILAALLFSFGGDIALMLSENQK